MSQVEDKLREMGLELPEAPKPVAAYIPAKHVGELVYVSGQIPLKDGQIAYTGKVGQDLSIEDGYEAAKLCALNALAVVKATIGSLEKLVEVVHVRGYVNSASDFGEQPEVVNGASEFLGELLGDRGSHARAAVGVAGLPRGVPVEIEMVVRVESTP